jgi:hypothetical protein
MGCKSSVLRQFQPTINLNKETHEMSPHTMQALIESLITVFKIIARKPRLRLQALARAP